VGLLKDGAPADIVIVQTSEMAGLEKAGLVKPGTVKPLGRVDIAVGVKAGTPHPDISTYEKFRDALLAAGSVAYTNPESGSAGGLLIDKALNKPEFANLKRVHNARGASNEVPIWLEAAGQLRGAYGVDEIGLLPESMNAHLQFSIAVAANARHPEEAVAFENYVLQPQFAPVWTKWGVAR
jgi:molybdate transport system substrate-binding protein